MALNLHPNVSHGIPSVSSPLPHIAWAGLLLHLATPLGIGGAVAFIASTALLVYGFATRRMILAAGPIGVYVFVTLVVSAVVLLAPGLQIPPAAGAAPSVPAHP